MNDLGEDDISRVFQTLTNYVESNGYHLNPDVSFTKEIIKGLLVNQKRYGYWACPCRIADGNRDKDKDIICPCDYRDPDLEEFGTCYCALYVSQDIVDGKMEPEPIPDRRPLK